MRVSWHVNLVAGALVALMFVAGCGDGNDTNIILGGETPTPGARTPTPVRTATAGAKTATPGAVATPTETSAAATPTETSAGAATPTATTNTSNPTPTSTPSGSGVDADVQSITSDVLPFLTSTSLLTGGSTSALTLGSLRKATTRTADADSTDNCPDGGTRTESGPVNNETITLTACKVSQAQLGHFQFDGTIVITLTSLSGGTINFDFTSIDLDHGNHTVNFSGTLVLTVSLPSGNFGPLLISTPEGDLTLNATNVTIDSNRHLVSGSGSITDDDDNFTVDTIAMTVVQGGATANFTVTFDDASVNTYTVNLTSGQITQTS
jgi:hypothetical protein